MAGFVTATTRQNAGRFRKAVEPSGGAKVGPDSSSADLIAVSGSRRAARLAHAPGAGAAAGTAISPARATPPSRARAANTPERKKKNTRWASIVSLLLRRNRGKAGGRARLKY